MVNKQKTVKLFDLSKVETNDDSKKLNSKETISPSNSKSDKSSKNYLAMVGVVLIAGLSHGFVIGILSGLL